MMTGWAIVRSSAHWYHVARVAFVDGYWWELYWHDSLSTRGKSKKIVREYAKNACALVLLPDTYAHHGPVMNRLQVIGPK